MIDMAGVARPGGGSPFLETLKENLAVGKTKNFNNPERTCVLDFLEAGAVILGLEVAFKN